MTVAMMIDNPAGSRELYEKILDRLGSEVPLGGILHLAGPSPRGGWRVVEVWESEDEARKFLAERFAPAFRAAGASGPPPPTEFWPVHVLEAAERAARTAPSTAHGGAR